MTYYQWNNANQLTAINGNGENATFAYDAFGLMVSQTEDGVTQNFVYDGQNLALVLNASGQVIDRELYGSAVDQVLATESGPAGTSPGTVSWYATDNQGTVRDVLQYVFASGSWQTQVVDHVVYDSFGQVTWQSSATDQPRLGDAGMRYDPMSGMYYDRFRWYNPQTGDFMSQDPTGLGPDVNPYRYCGNSPTNYTDPTGLDTIPIPVEENAGPSWEANRELNLGSFGTSATTPFTGGSGILEPLPNSPQLVLSDSGLGSYYADPTALPVPANDGMGYQGNWSIQLLRWHANVPVIQCSRGDD